MSSGDYGSGSNPTLRLPKRERRCRYHITSTFFGAKLPLLTETVTRTAGLLALAICLAAPLHADSKNAADYPLRLHIFNTDGTTFYHNRLVEETKGTGRANLYENGEPRGLEFSFNCSEKIEPSFGFETYPAKWKKRSQELVVLFSVIGKSNAYFTCNLTTQIKDYAYTRGNGGLSSESPAEFKAWMTAHDYDPEHGKNTPTNTGATLAPLDQARQYLTGANKDTEKAKKLLLDIVQKGSADPETLVWADIYLGYIEDRAKNRQAAVAYYEKAVAVENAPPGSISVAKHGLQQPLTWIRHLDTPSTQPPAAH